MKLNEYQDLSKRTLNSNQTENEQLSNYCLGLAGEAGEVCDIVKKNLHHGHFLNRGNLRLELGDVMFYVSAIATLIGVTLEEIAVTNIGKLQLRYPNGFDKERSINREEGK